MKFEKASAIACKYRDILAPMCERINIAGSIRRERAEVKDIEIVCLPKGITLIPFVETVNSWQKVRGEPTGRYTQRQLPEGIHLDLFIPQRADYFRQFAIRTGSADYSAKVIATAWRMRAWVGTEDGLRRQQDCLQKGKTWKVNVPEPVLPPSWLSEEEFFEWLGLKWIEPREREL